MLGLLGILGLVCASWSTLSGSPTIHLVPGRAGLTGPESPGAGPAALTGQCPCCGGLGLAVPEPVAALTGVLERAAAG